MNNKKKNPQHIPRPIFSVENIKRDCNIPNILDTSISHFDDILHSSCCHIVRVAARIINVIVTVCWLCLVQVAVGGGQRPLLHLRGTSLDSEEYERAYGEVSGF